MAHADTGRVRFSRKHGRLSRDATSATPRVEWRVWSSLPAASGSIPRLPTFSDYAIDNPEYPDLDFRVIKMTANVRYTTDQDWLIVKGHVIQKGARSQYPGLAAGLSAIAQYCGPEYSWGDGYVNDCANGEDGPGSATTWRQVGTNHHLTFVVNQIASFCAS